MHLPCFVNAFIASFLHFKVWYQKKTCLDQTYLKVSLLNINGTIIFSWECCVRGVLDCGLCLARAWVEGLTLGRNWTRMGPLSIGVWAKQGWIATIGGHALQPFATSHLVCLGISAFHSLHLGLVCCSTRKNAGFTLFFQETEFPTWSFCMIMAMGIKSYWHELNPGNLRDENIYTGCVLQR